MAGWRPQSLPGGPRLRRNDATAETDEPIPRIRIVLALVVGLATMGHGAYSSLTQAAAPGTAVPVVVMGAGAVIFPGGAFRWDYRIVEL